MKPLTIIECAAEDGLTLTASPDGNIKIIGDQNKINEWIETIRKNKSTILAELRAASDVEEQEEKYSVLVSDASTDPVLVKVGIKGIATFNLEIPRAHYDGIALLEVLEEYSSESMPERKAA